MDRRTFSKLVLLGSTLPNLNFNTLPATENDRKKPTLLKLKKNVVMMSVNLGFLPQNFNPEGDNLDSRYLSKFSSIHDRMTIFPGIEQPERLGGHRNHHSVFTCQSKYGKINTPFASLDQLIASKTIQESKHKSLITGVSRSDLGFNMNGISIPSITKPDALMSHLFGKVKSLKDLESQQQLLNEFKKILVDSKNDKHFRAVLEENIAMANNNLKWAKVEAPEIDYTFNSTKNPILDLPIYLDLISLALQKNQCRIISLNIGDNAKVPLEGVTVGYHENSHHANDKTKLKELGIIEDFIADQIVNFMTGLKKANLLDNTIVLVAGNMGNPSLHSMRDMSVILAGGGFKHQKIIPCKEKGVLIHPLANLYVSILHQAGLENEKTFAGVKGNLDNYLL